MAFLDPVFLSGLAAPARPAAALLALPAALVPAGTLGALALLNLAAARLGLVDHPDGGRKRHAGAVPLTGGLAILAGASLGAAAGLQLGATPRDVLALLAIVTVIHAFDDQSANGRPGLNPRQRLVIDGFVALALTIVTGRAIDSLGAVGGFTLGLGPLAIPFTILIYLAVTNAYNMIDGLDGLALSQFLIAFAGLGLAYFGANGAAGLPAAVLVVALASLVVLAANLGLFGGFLRCFLGDSGARLLGFFLVYVLVAEGGRLFSPPGALFFVALPLLDLCAVFAERLRVGCSPLQADRRHLHHLLVDAGLSPGRVVAVMALVSIAFLVLHALMQRAGLGDLAMTSSFIALAIPYWVSRRRLVLICGWALAARHAIEPAE